VSTAMMKQNTLHVLLPHMNAQSNTQKVVCQGSKRTAQCRFRARAQEAERVLKKAPSRSGVRGHNLRPCQPGRSSALPAPSFSK
jgi:hypothetical protein